MCVLCVCDVVDVYTDQTSQRGRAGPDAMLYQRWHLCVRASACLCVANLRMLVCVFVFTLSARTHIPNLLQTFDVLSKHTKLDLIETQQNVMHLLRFF